MIKLNTATNNTVRGTHKGFKRFLCHYKLATHTEQAILHCDRLCWHPDVVW